MVWLAIFPGVVINVVLRKDVGGGGVVEVMDGRPKA